MLDSCTQYVPTISATRDMGPKIELGIFSPTPRTEEGGAVPVQKVSPGFSMPIFRAGVDAPVVQTTMWMG